MRASRSCAAAHVAALAGSPDVQVRLLVVQVLGKLRGKPISDAKAADLPLVIVDTLGAGDITAADPKQAGVIAVFEPGADGRSIAGKAIDAVKSGEVSFVGHALLIFHVITGSCSSLSRLMTTSRRRLSVTYKC